jgi:tetratricopeptide (TPR) repeat protein
VGHAGAWEVQDLSGRDPVSLAAVELEALAEAAWWLCKTDESIAARQRAYAAFRDAKDDRGAARAAARLFHDHFYRGEGAVAVGWLRRGFRHLEGAPDCVEGGWLQMAEAELHLHQGPLEQAEDGAAHAIQVAREHGDADLAAVAMQIQGRALVAQGRIEEGLALLDEAMTCVLTGELAPLYTGWVYCSVILACKDLADLQRASEWTEAARLWCEALPATTPYRQGLCRIYRGEVLALRGAWAEAEAEMRRAHQELLAHKPRGAAEASYGVGRSCGVVGIWPGRSRRSCGPSSWGGIRSRAWRCCGWRRDGWRRPRPRCARSWRRPRWIASAGRGCWPPRSR